MSECSQSSVAPLRRSRGEVLAALVLFIGTAIPLSIRLGAAPPTIRAEMRCWQVVEGMHATGEWLVPYRDGQPALNKPPLFYWAGALASWIAGKATYATLRVPSAIAALALLALTWYWGRSVGGPKLGLVSAGVLAFTWMFYHQGRNGSFEMLLALLTNVALFSFDRLYWTGRRFLAPLLALLVAAAFLTKGPPALLIVGLPIVLFLAFRKEIRRIATWPVVLGSLAALALGLVWFAVILIRVPGAWDHFISEALLPAGVESGLSNSAKHYHSPAFFFLRLPLILRLSAFLLPVMVWRGWKTRFWRDDPRLRFFAWIAGGLLIAFSLFPQKQEHYLLPLFPAFAILMAEAALWAAEPKSGVRWAWLGAPAVLLAIGTLLSVGILAFYFHALMRITVAKLLPLHLALVALGCAAFWMAVKRKWAGSGAALLLAMWLFLIAFFGSYDVVKRRFATGEIEKHAGYDAEHWLEMKRKYPFVANEFRLSSRFIKDEVPPK